MSDEKIDLTETIKNSLAPLTKVLDVAQKQLEEAMKLIETQGKAIDSFTNMTSSICESIAQAMKDCDDPQVLVSLHHIQVALKTMRDEVC